MFAFAGFALRHALVVTSVLLLAACDSGIFEKSGGPRELRQWGAKTRAHSSVAVPGLPSIREFEAFEYNSDGMRNPFGLERGGSQLSASGAGSKHEEPLLEHHSLDQLKMVGTIGAGSSRVGLVMGPDMVTYRVIPGDYLGNNKGRVQRVREDCIDLVELASNGTGGRYERPAALRLDH